jgi:hypothetical protein
MSLTDVVDVVVSVDQFALSVDRSTTYVAAPVTAPQVTPTCVADPTVTTGAPGAAGSVSALATPLYPDAPHALLARTR